MEKHLGNYRFWNTVMDDFTPAKPVDHELFWDTPGLPIFEPVTALAMFGAEGESRLKSVSSEAPQPAETPAILAAKSQHVPASYLASRYEALGMPAINNLANLMWRFVWSNLSQPTYRWKRCA
jgi:hypothetical protein